MWMKLGPVFTAAQGEYGSVYWPWVLDAQQYPALAFSDRFVMYYSTDHDMGAGGIAAATAPNPAGPWLNWGQVYVDAGPGFSTETPSVWWDGVKFRLWYQQAGVNNQSTLAATSPDGITWTKVGLAGGITVQPGPFPGDGHCGYARPFRTGVPGEMYAYHLMGGTNVPHFGMSISADSGTTWRTDPRPLMYGWDQVAAAGMPGHRIEWNSGDVLPDGRWIGLVSNFSSGGGAVARHIVEARISDDGRRLVGAIRKLFPADPPANIRALFVLGSHLYYQVDDTIYLAQEA